MRLSIIVPALNESGNLEATLTHLQAMRARGVEIILVDGGSTDDTRDIAALLVDRVISSERGRAKQMNAGAAIASGDAFLFLHADSILPADADRDIAQSLENLSNNWGRFDVSIAGRHGMFPVIAWFMNHRSRLTGIATGDQGIFVRRDTFEKIGGFRDQPLMEDIEICKRLISISAPVCLRTKIKTSGRRWEKHGVWRTIWLMWRLRYSYYRGASPESLHRAYTS
jgi:rSAM/selenodomain-associated transferase 2